MTADALQVLVDNDLIKVAPLNDNFEYLDDKINTKNSILNGALNGKVNKSGDTITGNLTIPAGTFISKQDIGNNEGGELVFEKGDTDTIGSNVHMDIQDGKFRIFTDGTGGAIHFAVDLKNQSTYPKQLAEFLAPDYSRAISVSFPYTVTQTGWCMGYVFTGNGGTDTIAVNGIDVCSTKSPSSGDNAYAWGTKSNTVFAVSVGDVVTHDGTHTAELKFLPMKGAI